MKTTAIAQKTKLTKGERTRERKQLHHFLALVEGLSRRTANLDSEESSAIQAAANRINRDYINSVARAQAANRTRTTVVSDIPAESQVDLTALPETDERRQFWEFATHLQSLTDQAYQLSRRETDLCLKAGEIVADKLKKQDLRMKQVQAAAPSPPPLEARVRGGQVGGKARGNKAGRKPIANPNKITLAKRRSRAKLETKSRTTE